ncbi:helix-turn-helix domain-containing protein [Pedobacter agri]|uniref:helix-turn-helix domain-containing protein n=1 Tax=Pedobacter agri TaxID=454586 RepID=UPI0029311390|nr:AraC family transcriptional regulator [Pedobacter agri]
MSPEVGQIWDRFCMNVYTISLKRNVNMKVRYGQQFYDFDKGIMSFTAPQQVQSVDSEGIERFREDGGCGYMLVFHPSFLYHHPLAKTIKTYGFFSYAVNEALHLSELEESNVSGILGKIEAEYQNIDLYTQDIILSQIDLLLNYCNRFYQRQFLTRKPNNHDLVMRIEKLVDDYFDSEEMLKRGMPSLELFANEMNLSAHYLSDMLRTVSGRSLQQYIHEKLIAVAKEHLSSTDMSVANIAYLLGFEYPQSFNKLFKKKTNISPLQFRRSFN